MHTNTQKCSIHSTRCPAERKFLPACWEAFACLAGQTYTFTVAEGANGQDGRISVNYDGFIDDVGVGDILLVDGGLQSLSIQEKQGKDVLCQVVDGGIMTSRYDRCPLSLN